MLNGRSGDCLKDNVIVGMLMRFAYSEQPTTY